MNVTTVGLTSDSRISVDANHLTISNIKRADIQMLQCNASNVHGYLFANAYLNVQGNTAASHCNKIHDIVAKNVVLQISN